ncbi:hypothetical protein GCM10025857_23580 [Alicyclobacillus contaminans]|uniref:efflux RND transporter periplasmic adaptor subunit n=1 Tax=Alicyclobacillus contaminans TaxID=392016 RepID=UPI0003FAE920|nr:efflux RND transporter periplasmic adaptor subunit [Alicyclobacillus contaminans]GMA51001.1 hypothetical protein GCM10025857_23580 [Alicyclobacillus contaminans]
MNKERLNQVKAAILTLSSLAFLAGCGLNGKQVATSLPPEAVAVQTVHLSKQSIGDTFIGSITPYIQTTLSPGASGTLAELDVRAGSVVKAGQVLGRLSDVTAVPAQNAADQAAAALASAETQYQDALALYNDNMNAEQQVTNAQNAVDEQKAALQTAQINLQKAQLQAQASLNGGGTPQDEQALQAVVTADQQAVTSATKQLELAQSNLQILQQTLDDAKAQYGSITSAQVQQAYQAYQDALNHYNSWQKGAFAGTNPYSAELTSTQTVYQALSNGYNTLQQAQQSYNQGLQAVSQASSALASAQANLSTAQKNLADANPDSNTNQAQQIQLGVAAAQASLKQAQAQYNAAVTSLQLAKQIASDKTQAKANLDSALNALRQDQVNVQTANRSLQAQVRNDEVISPISGYVQAVGAQVGQSVGPQTSLVTIASMSPVMATVQVPETDIGKVHKGSQMNVFVPTTDQTLNGHVLDVHPQLDSTTNQYPVDIQIDSSGNNLLPGMAVQAQMQSQASKPVILVPADSVLSLQSGANEVFVVRNGHAYSKMVQVGNMSSTQYEIISGLAVGDQLVVQGQNLLSDGDAVKVVSTDGSASNGSTKAAS